MAGDYVQEHNERMRRTSTERESRRAPTPEPRFVEEIEDALTYWDSVKDNHAGSQEAAGHWVEAQGKLFAELDRAKSMRKFKTKERAAHG